MSIDRFEYRDLSSPGYKQLLGAKSHVMRSRLEPELIELVYLRASQINGCAFCTDLHFRDAIKMGVDARKLNSVIVWRESRFFSDAERAALEWTETVTLIADAHNTLEKADKLRQHFTDAQIADMTLAISIMNALNRFAIAFEEPQQD